MVNRTDARGFVADFNRTYEEKTELTRLCKVREYEDGDESLDFFQIGRRAAVPTGLIDTGRYRYVSDSAVGALCEGEKKFVVEKLNGIADDKRIRTLDVSESPIEEARRVVEDSDTVLVPRNETGDEMVARWEDGGRIRGLGEGKYVTSGEDVEENTGVWLQRHGGDDVFVLDSDDVTVVRKPEGDAEAPRFGHVEEYGELCHGSELGVYFGDGTHADDGFVDVVYRVVVSEPVVENGGACRLRC